MNAIHELDEEQSMDMLQEVVSCLVLNKFTRKSETEIIIDFSDMGNEGNLPTPRFVVSLLEKKLFVKVE
jgi:hypothetical protein